MGRFDFTFLGGFKVRLDDNLLVDFATDKVCALLVYLALEPPPHPRNKVAALFWPDIAEQTALTNLRQTVRRLRQSLERAERGASERLLVSTRQSLYIDSELLTIDVINFERLLSLCEAHTHAKLATCSDCLPILEEAANLYHGELLAGFSLVDAPAFEEWLLLRREYFQEQALRLFHTLATAYDLRGEDEQTHHWAARQLALDPLRESAHRQLIRSLVRRGQRLAALAQFERCRHLLHSELGVEPSPETMALYEEIRVSRFPDMATGWQGDKTTEIPDNGITRSPPSPSALPPHNLPSERPPLIGREQVLAELSARLQQPGLRLLTLVGAGGMGKTRLALALAQSILDSGFWSLDADEPPSTPKSNIPNPKFPDGVFFVPLASLANPASLAPAIATTLGLTLPGASPHQALLQILRYKRLLLILDNFEHLLEGAGLVADLLQAAPGVQIITTSRERLNLHDEHLYLVPPLAFTPSGSSDADLTNASAQLFVQSARHVKPDFAVNPANAAAVLRICQLAQGMPLALELAAAHVGMLPLAAIAAEIERNAEFLAVDWRDMPERQRSMSAVFAWSWQSLGDDERRVLRQLSVFRGGFTLEAAQRVAGADLSVLTRLLHKSLLQLHDTASAGGRYTIHELLRQFAAARLDAAGERAVVEEQHSRFYLDYVADRGERLGRREPRQASEEIQAELDNVRQAWHWAATQVQLASLAKAAYAWWQFCLFRGLESEGRQSFTLAVERAQQLSPVDADAQVSLSKLLAIHANYLAGQGQDARMAAQARQAIALGASCGEMEGETFGYFVLGRALYDLQQPREATAAYQHAIQLARAFQADHPDREMLREAEWMAHNWLQGIALSFDDYPGGRAYTMQALHLCQSLGKRRGELYCLTDLAWLNLFMGDFAAAGQNFAKVRQLARDLGYHWMEMPAHHGLGEVTRLRGEYTQAQTLLDKAASLAYELGQQSAEARIWASLVRLHTFAGNQEAAHRWQQRLSQLHGSAQLPKECRVQGLVAFAVLALCAGEHAAALAYAEQAHQLVQTGELLHRRADALVVLGHARAGMAQWAAAAEAHQEAIRCYERLGSTVLAVEPQAGLAQSALAQGDRAQAQQLVETILPILAEHPHASLNTPFFSWLTCHWVLTANEDPRAGDILQTAYTLLQQDAASIQDVTLRRLFLEEVPVHRALQQAFEEGQGAGDKAEGATQRVPGPPREREPGSLGNGEGTPSSYHPISPSPHHDWVEIPPVSQFYGRERELAQLAGLLKGDLPDHRRARLVIVLGIGGAGKTSLAATVVRAVASQFATVLWRSLLNAPPLDEILRSWLQILSRQTLATLPATLDERIQLLLTYLRRQRCLLVLDNLESILEAGARAGQPRPGYEDYIQLIHELGSANHQSCLLLTSREHPLGAARLAENTPFVHVLVLSGLDVEAGEALLQANGLAVSRQDARELIERYSGNPLALRIVANTIADLFGGDILAFQQEGPPVFDDIRGVLDQQFERLSDLEREILIWLAIEREPVTVQTLRSNLVQPPTSRQLLEALRALQQRSLLEKAGEGVTLQNVVIEYLTDRLIDGVCDELSDTVSGWQDDSVTESLDDQVTLSPLHPVTLSLLNRYALLKAQAKAYIRQSQVRMILQPVAERLQMRLGSRLLQQRLRQHLERLRAATPPADASVTAQASRPIPGYAGGNILNLVRHLGFDLAGFDFSRLSVWQADLRGASFAAIDFTDADLAHTAFTLAFDPGIVQFDASGQILVASIVEGTFCLWHVQGAPAYSNDFRLYYRLHAAFRHPGNHAYPIAASADGALLACAGLDHAVYVWSAETGERLHRWVGHSDEIYGLAFGARPGGGQQLASSSRDGTVRLWHIGADQSQLILYESADAISGLAFRPDGAILAGGGSGKLVRLWDTHSGQVIQTLHGHTREIECLAFSPDGALLASGAHDGTIRLWDVREPAANSQHLRTLHGHSHIVRVLMFHPDSQLLASGGADQIVRLWEIQSGQPRQTFTGHTNEVASLAFSPDGATLASSSSVNRTVLLWETHTGRALDVFYSHSTAVQAVAFSPSETLLASSGVDGIVRLWNVYTSEEMPPEWNGHIAQYLQGHTEQVFTLAFSPDGRYLASGGVDHTVRLWEIATGKTIRILRGHTDAVKALAFSPDGQWLASASADRTIRIWQVAGANQRLAPTSIRVLRGHEDDVIAVAFHPDGRTLLSGSLDHTACLWNVESGQKAAVLQAHAGALFGVTFSPDGRFAVTNSWDRTVYRWDVTTRQHSEGWNGNPIHALGIVFSPDGKAFASCSADQTIQLRDAQTGEVRVTLDSGAAAISSFAFSATAPILASSSWDGAIRLWDVATGRCLKTLRAPGPYTGMNITGTTGLSEAQKAALMTLGAYEENHYPA